MNNKSLLRFFSLLLAAACVFIVVSCGTKSSDSSAVTFWAMGSEGEIVQKLIPEFERRNPNIKINVQVIPWTAAQEKLITAYASDNMPDVCQLGNTWIPQFVALNAIDPLDSLVRISSVIKKEKYFDGIWDTNVIDSLVYGIPWYIDTRIIYYRTDIFAEAGYDRPVKTWDEFIDVSRKIRANFKARGEDKFAVYLPTNEWVPYIVFGLQNGADLLRDNFSYGNFSSKEFSDAFAFLMKFYEEELTPVGISQVTNVYQAFAEGYFSVYISGPWNIPEFKKWMKDDLADKWMTAALPGPNDSTPGISTAGGSSLVICRQSQNKEAAWKFIEYLSEKETQLAFYELLSNLPAVQDAWQDSVLSGNQYMKAFYEQFKYVVPTPKVVEWEQIVFAKVQQYAEAVARKQMTVQEAMRSLDSDVDIILEKRRYLISQGLF